MPKSPVQAPVSKAVTIAAAPDPFTIVDIQESVSDQKTEFISTERRHLHVIGINGNTITVKDFPANWTMAAAMAVLRAYVLPNLRAECQVRVTQHANIIRPDTQLAFLDLRIPLCWCEEDVSAFTQPKLAWT